jgi:hypothetical protein
MLIEGVWSSLSESWQFIDDLRTRLGLDEVTFRKVFNFLGKWGYIEYRGLPKLSVRRRRGVMSPLLTVQLLRSFTNQPESKAKTDRVLAERVSCRTCGSQSLRLIDGNQVECSRCSERQWYTIERGDLKRLSESLDRPVTRLSVFFRGRVSWTLRPQNSSQAHSNPLRNVDPSP